MKREHEVEFTKASTRGQIVIPQDIREKIGMREGSLFAVMQPKTDTIILKKVDSKISKEDLETIKKVDEAWKDFEAGRFKKYSREEFLKHMKSW